MTLQLHISRYEDIGYGVARQLLISGGGEKRVISPQTEERREDSEESNRWTYANGFDSEYSTIPGAGFECGLCLKTRYRPCSLALGSSEFSELVTVLTALLTMDIYI